MESNYARSVIEAFRESKEERVGSINALLSIAQRVADVVLEPAMATL